MDVPGSFNAMIYATTQPTHFENIQSNYGLLAQSPDTPELLLVSLQRVIMSQRPLPEGGVVFNDDWAPIEWITNSMVLSYVFSAGVESLP
jgi:hypothetical protein